MRIGGIAIAVVVSMVLSVRSARSQLWQSTSAIHSSSQIYTATPIHRADWGAATGMTVQPVSIHDVRHRPIGQDILPLERTPTFELTQHQASHHLRELIRRYNPDLSASDARDIAHWTEFYSRQYGIDPRLIAGLVARESGFDPKARSRTGARGLGQISAALGKDLGIRDRYDIQENLEGTTRWIRTLYDTWRQDGVEDSQAIHWSLASYRQGLARTREIGIPANVARYINEVYDIANGLPNSPTS
ncbi:MAG: transglycosylase SLT domain-containing protein [Cyanobacteria bacterium J06597_1]